MYVFTIITIEKKNGRYLTTKVNSVFAVLSANTKILATSENEQGGDNTSLSCLVAKGGVEPPTSGL